MTDDDFFWVEDRSDHSLYRATLPAHAPLWHGESWHWQRKRFPELCAGLRLPQNSVWYFGDVHACTRWFWRTGQVPQPAIPGSSPSLLKALEYVTTARSKVYACIAVPWQDAANEQQDKEPLYQVIATEEVTEPLASFCTTCIQKGVHSSALRITSSSDLLEQTYLALVGYLTKQQVADVHQRLRKRPGYNERQVRVLQTWKRVLRANDMLLFTVHNLILFDAIDHAWTLEQADLEGEREALEANPFRTRMNELTAKLEGMLADRLGVSL